MLQKLPPLDAIADLPASKPLAAARTRFDEAVKAEAEVLRVFRSHLARLSETNRFVQSDTFATQAEAAAIAATAEVRLAGAEVEKAKRAHNEALTRHFQRNAAALQELSELIQRASHASDVIGRALNAAEADGFAPSHSLQRVKRVRKLLKQATETELS